MLFTLFAFCVFASYVEAQDLTVSGTVISAEDNLPMIGVTVMKVGTTEGTITDLDGKYSLKAKKGDVLQFTYTGMLTNELKVNGPTLDLIMDTDVAKLDEVVVIGYGAVTKKEVTGAVSQLKSEDLDRVVTSDVGNAIQGLVSGVNVTAASGEPGEASNIQIRGITSLSGANTPLFVVDGIPQDGDPRLARNEIETIDILKDAASASVYGTRGAAGVILITTKRGQNGKTKVSFDQSIGVQTVTSGIDLMNTAEQIRFDTLVEQYVDGAFGSQIANRPEWAENETNLSDYIYVENPLLQTYDLGISGGTKEFSYNVVAGLFKQEGIIINSGFERYNARFNTGYNKGRWSLRAIGAITTENRSRTNTQLVLNSIRYRPYFPQIQPESDAFEVSGGPSETVTNLVVRQLKNENISDRDRINGSLNATYRLTDNLKFVANAGTGITNLFQRNFGAAFATVDLEEGGLTEIDPTLNFTEMISSRGRTYSFDGSLNYKKKFGKHSLSTLATLSFDERSFAFFEAGRQGVANNEIKVLNGGTLNPYANSGVGNQQDYVIKTLGTLGRLQYNFRQKYMLSASVRRDGSSKFSQDNRWGVFPSAAAAWNVSSEKFWKPFRNVSDNFKVRASIGTTGNESFPAYRYSAVIGQGADYVFGDNNLAFGAIQRAFANSLVKWETSVQTNFGIDLGLWANKLLFTADFYTTNKNDMLFPVELPPSAGVLSGTNADLILNIGNMTNQGIELALNYKTRVGKMRMDIGGTFTKNVNEITSINGSTELIINADGTAVIGDPASSVTSLAVGHEVGAYFLYQTDGVINEEEELAEYLAIVPNAKLGDTKYIDTNADGIISEADRVYSGSALPDFEYGINVKLNYQNVDFSMLWYGAVGHEIMNGSAAYAYYYGRHGNLRDMWTPENTDSNVPIYRGTGKEHPNLGGATDLWLEDGSYLRLRNVTLGYKFPQSMLRTAKINNLRIYVSSQNPLTLTNYTGYDPEVGGNVVNRGLDRGRYPFTSQYLFGVQLDF